MEETKFSMEEVKDGLKSFFSGLIKNAKEDEKDVKEVKKLKTEEKKEVENEEVDKRKLIDKVAGMMKSAGCSDELIRTAIKDMEKAAYDKSEAGTVDNKCKNSAEPYQTVSTILNSLDSRQEVYMSTAEKIELGNQYFD